MGKKWELLKHAYDNYPKGAKFISFATNKEIATSSGVFKISQNHHQGVWVTDIETKFVVFCPDKKQWAEIVSDKKPLLVSENIRPIDDFKIRVRIEATLPKEVRIELGGCFAAVIDSDYVKLDYIGGHGLKISHYDWNKVNNEIKTLNNEK